MPHISIAAEKLTEFAGLSITNSLIYSLIITCLLLLTAVWVQFRVNPIPSKLQSIIEVIIEYMYNLVEGIAGKNAAEFFPLVITLFIFILLSNLLGLLPGLAGIGFDHVINGENIITPFLRSPSADLSTTFALALISIVSIQYFGLKHLGLKIHLSKYINFKSPIAFFIGFLELLSEFARILSFSFRLFGNIFAGEVLLLVVGSLLPWFIPATFPFLALEIFVGLIQAYVFAILTTVLLDLSVQH